MKSFIPTDNEEDDNRSSSSATSSQTDDHRSISKSYASGSKSDTDGENESDNIRAHLTKQETKNVDRIRIAVLIAIVLSGIGITLAIYFIAKRSEQDSFNAQYDGAANKIIESFESIVTKVGSINSIGIALTSQGYKDENSSSWPFVTLPAFQQRSASARLLSSALFISTAPIVTEDNRDQWEEYSVGDSKNWIDEGIRYQEKYGLGTFEYNPPPLDEVLMTNYTRKTIMYFNNVTNETTVDMGPGPYLPTWQTSPVLKKRGINDNLFHDPKHSYLVNRSISEKKTVFGRFDYGPAGGINATNTTTALLATLRSFVEKKQVGYLGALVVSVYIPIYENFNDLVDMSTNTTNETAVQDPNQNRQVVGVLHNIVHWRAYLRSLLPSSIRGIGVVLENTCDGFFTYTLYGAEANVTGFGDLHQTQFSSHVRTGAFDVETTITDGTQAGIPVDVDGCNYLIHVYPTQEFSDQYITNTPIVITCAVALVFMFSIILFYIYNVLVERRQRIILNKAAHSTAIVSSMFPKQVRDRLLQENDGPKATQSSRMKTFLTGNQDPSSLTGNESQIADLFPNCTVLFADIAGFTAWSSSRGPEHVFSLLQSIYHEFDQVAKRRKVFKVETIGDCYLAVTGVPEPQSNHALLMARFAYECKIRMNNLTKKLDLTLGPDCSELKMRFGMHSGPVTAGVLRGDRARFQLFGDTVNTAARMESTGVPDKVQLSQATCDLLIADGKSHWIVPRQDAVTAKGKGTMNTYWLKIGDRKAESSDGNGSSHDTTSLSDPSRVESKDSGDYVKRERLCNWMVELLLDHTKAMLAIREETDVKAELAPIDLSNGATSSIPLDEVKEVIPLLKFDPIIAQKIRGTSSKEIHADIAHDLHLFVSMIAEMYHNNPFHNFEHACHVSMSVSKLLKRVVSTDLGSKPLDENDETKSFDQLLHRSTYGISSDPVAQFAIVFSAMIHDVDHRGCSNVQLAKEEQYLGERYRNQSIAEQNSLDIAWNLLMSPQFDNLRRELFGTVTQNENSMRFREIIVNSVLATDIFDKELNELRRKRWEKAFSHQNENVDMKDEDVLNRKATIVIEHIIQASDVAHTMQHWHVYQKWNRKLFSEMHEAFRSGRMAVDPATFWYKGEISFFDNYIIPLAKKLKECEVFGVSSDEYLNYAENNRQEWEARGESIVEEIVREINMDDGVE